MQTCHLGGSRVGGRRAGRPSGSVGGTRSPALAVGEPDGSRSEQYGKTSERQSAGPSPVPEVPRRTARLSSLHSLPNADIELGVGPAAFHSSSSESSRPYRPTLSRHWEHSPRCARTSEAAAWSIRR